MGLAWTYIRKFGALELYFHDPSKVFDRDRRSLSDKQEQTLHVNPSGNCAGGPEKYIGTCRSSSIRTKPSLYVQAKEQAAIPMSSKTGMPQQKNTNPSQTPSKCLRICCQLELNNRIASPFVPQVVFALFVVGGSAFCSTAFPGFASSWSFPCCNIAQTPSFHSADRFAHISNKSNISNS